MAITSALILQTDTTILTVPSLKKYAITAILVCNYAATAAEANDSAFDMHIIQGVGGVKSNANKVLNSVAVPAQETFTMSMEKIILDEGDRIVLTSPTNDKLSATISYLEV